MFGQTLKLVTLALAVAVQVNAHALVDNPIGVTGTPARSDVKRPNTANPCGAGVNIASALAASTPVQAAADGTFTATATSFNGGNDGSREFTAKVDLTGTGKSFTGAVTMVKNGVQNAPQGVTSEQIVGKLPAGAACTGGKCLVQFVSTAGFGDCVLVEQAGAAAGGAAAAAGASTAATAATGATAAAANNAAGKTAATGNAAAAAGGAKAKAAKAAAGAKAKAAKAAAGGKAKAKAAKAQAKAAAKAKAAGGAAAAGAKAKAAKAAGAARDFEIERRGFMGWVWAPSF